MYTVSFVPKLHGRRKLWPGHEATMLNTGCFT